MTMMQGKKVRHTRKALIETALLGQGLPSLTNDYILREWRHSTSIALVWLENGRITFGNIKEFLQLRGNPDMERIDASNLSVAIRERVSGYMTAAAVMRVAAQTGNFIVVTAGMGGIRGKILSNDLVTLSQMPIVLVASSPKDTLDLPATLGYLRGQGVCLIGNGTDQCNGFLFIKESFPLDGVYCGQKVEELIKNGPCLILNPLPLCLRFTDGTILANATAQGEAAARQMRQFHPAVNAALDRLTGGKASILQLRSLMDNIDLALSLH
ncbi:pseudouridine-5'-phosphate glycosidase [Neomoorella glycerini]|uniref:pseudouridine-5'-phosphate glycosidase n=1 Tax=Neomoorella glycerini TaxID=55779 RepID=UPI0012E23619|nr:pseudouridine-5'-phosphate glycosidase [Moorella glycerini]